MMKFKKIWFFGNTSRDIDKDDYITCYMRDDNKVKIECCHGFSNWNSRWYDVYVIDGDDEKLVLDGFGTLKEAKEYALTI